jgi:hypothetical protein
MESVREIGKLPFSAPRTPDPALKVNCYHPSVRDDPHRTSLPPNNACFGASLFGARTFNRYVLEYQENEGGTDDGILRRSYL